MSLFRMKAKRAPSPRETAVTMVKCLEGASSIGIGSYLNGLNNWITPIALRRVMFHVALMDPALFVKLRKRQDVAEILRTAFLQGFRRREIVPGATLYSGRPQLRKKRLLVVFCGQSHRPGMPLPIFLQHTDVRQFDVLYFQDKNFNHFRSGVSGIPDSFAEVISIYENVKGRRKYRETYVLGVSAGGLAAMRFAVQTTPARAISIGAQPANDTLRIFNRQATKFSSFDPVCACLHKMDRPYFFVHAADKPVFKAFAGNAAKLTGGQTIAVHGGVGHAILGDLWRAGTLAQFYPQILDHGFPQNLGTKTGWTISADAGISFRASD